jgi:hypothetical protein
MEEAIKLAIEKGGYPHYSHTEEPLMYDAKCMIVLDPKFWQALGKALGWGKISYENDFGDLSLSELEIWSDEDAWRYQAHKYFDLVLTGGDTEKFYKELISPLTNQDK